MPEAKLYDGNNRGRMTRDGMLATLADRRAVLHQGRVITRPEDLPSEADLAEGNPEQEEAVRQAIQAQIAELTAQMNRLGKNTTGSATPGAHEAGVAAPGEGRVPGDLVGSVPPASGPDAPEGETPQEPSTDPDAPSQDGSQPAPPRPRTKSGNSGEQP